MKSKAKEGRGSRELRETKSWKIVSEKKRTQASVLGTKLQYL